MPAELSGINISRGQTDVSSASAETGALVTFGIAPDCPHTGYGYIEVDEVDGTTYSVQRFIEKPSLEDA